MASGKSFSEAIPISHGTHHDFSGLVVDPHAVQDHVPIWVGGRTLRSLRRAVALGDGWCPFGITTDTAARWLAAAEPPAGFEVVLAPEQPLDAIESPAAAEEQLAVLAAAGVTIARAHVVHRSLEHLLEQLSALAELVDR